VNTSIWAINIYLTNQKLNFIQFLYFKMSNSILDVSLNTSKKKLFCNHCQHDLNNYEEMKEHYSSEFHKYNLNRVTMNFNPLTLPEFLKKKEKCKQAINLVQTLKTNDSTSKQQTSLNCDVCKKTFSSHNKREEHFISKSHIQATKKVEEKGNTIKETVEHKTTKDDHTICLFCNHKNDTVDDNISHMIKIHKFEVPFASYVKNISGMMKVIIKKIFDYLACLSCDLQGFKNYKSLQNHMLDTQHTYVNIEDLEEFLYKFYDKKKLLAIEDKELRKSKEFKILKYKLKARKTTTKEIDSDGWETISEEEDEEKPKQYVYDSEGILL
jgi:pre-60S factor REI1